MDRGAEELKCADCSSQKGKRVCGRHGGRRVCSSCCGSLRSWQGCPVDCRHFPPERGPKMALRDVHAFTNKGDRLAGVQFLYLPNLYEFIFCNLKATKIEFLDTQRARVSCRFALNHTFSTSPDNLLAKDAWKRKFFPDGCSEHKLLPLLGIALRGQGLPDIETIALTPEGEVRVGGNLWLVVPPHQRPMFGPSADGKSLDTNPIWSMGIRNAMIFAPIDFGRDYELELTVMDVTSLGSDSSLCSRIGLIFPFGRLQMSPPKVVAPPGNSFRSMNLETLLPAPSPTYPGEQFTTNGVDANLIFCRGIRDQIQGEMSPRRDIAADPRLFAVLSKGPSSQLLTLVIQPSTPVQASLLQHSRMVNARLLPTLRKWLGAMGCPLQLALINLGDTPQSVSIEETNQSAGARRLETYTISPKTLEHIPLELPGLDADSHGDVSLAIEVRTSVSTILKTTASLRLLPIDHLTLRIEDEIRDWYRETVEAVTCWVTPYSKAVDEWVSEAKAYCPNGMGKASGVPVEIQLEALWQALRNRGFTYVDSSYSIDTGSPISYQRVLTPTDSLRLGYGNCIDLTVLFASALERLGFRPAILTTTDHAFLGWLADDGRVEGCLETTLVAQSDCAAAISRGQQEFGSEDQFNKPWHNRILDVVGSRSHGLLPLFD
jgi:hypothetical protein